MIFAYFGPWRENWTILEPVKPKELLLDLECFL